ncbi:MAG: hypothetical protein ABI406_04195 [Ktedonobacteraceae bacterium]
MQVRQSLAAPPFCKKYVIYVRRRGLTVYNPDAENMYRQESQPHQPHQPVSEQYNRPYPTNPPYPPYQSYPLTSENNGSVPGEKIHPQSPRRKEGNVAHTTKAQALAIVKTCKKWLVIGSVVCFGVFSGLAVTHVTGITSQAATNSATQQQQAAPDDPGQGGFFQQQPSQQGGNNFGTNSPSQGPVSGSNVS